MKLKDFREPRVKLNKQEERDLRRKRNYVIQAEARLIVQKIQKWVNQRRLIAEPARGLDVEFVGSFSFAGGPGSVYLKNEDINTPFAQHVKELNDRYLHLVTIISFSDLKENDYTDEKSEDEDQQHRDQIEAHTHEATVIVNKIEKYANQGLIRFDRFDHSLKNRIGYFGMYGSAYVIPGKTPEELTKHVYSLAHRMAEIGRDNHEILQKVENARRLKTGWGDQL